MTISAGLGIANFPFADGTGFWERVDLCDANGVNSIWQSDRIIGADANLECLSVMAALAGRTKNLKFGMNVASLGLRDPVITAKACATIDVLSNGRLLPAFGVGSSRSRDYTATGTHTRGRGKRAAEGLEILSRLWSQESVTFKGEFFDLAEATISPRPVQQPLPLWVGGSAKQAVHRTAKWGTGWQAGLETPEEVEPVIAAIKDTLPQYGRQIDEDHYGAGFAFRFGHPDEPICKKYNELLSARLGKDATQLSAIGGVDEMMRLLLRFNEVGVHKFILRPIAAGTTEYIEQTQQFIEQLQPAIKRLNHD